jgi:signal transduction histidine kinase
MEPPVMVDYLSALAALSEALDAGVDEPARLHAYALRGLLAGTQAMGGRLLDAAGGVLAAAGDQAGAPGSVRVAFPVSVHAEGVQAVGDVGEQVYPRIKTLQYTPRVPAVRQFPLETRGVTLATAELYYADPPDDEEQRYLSLAMQAVTGALYQARLLADQRQWSQALEEQVRERTAHAVRAERMVALGTLAQGVVAELERPLAAVHANLRAILDGIDRETAHIRGPGRRRVGDRIRETIGDSFLEVDRLSRLAQDLRRLVPSETTGKVRVDVNLLVQSALNLTRHRFAQNAEVRTDYGALPEVSCYPDRLVQAFANLLVNAAEAIHGSGEVLVRTSRQGARVVVAFRDSGVGIAPAQIDRIFEPFFTTKQFAEGVGLGLSIVREVVREHEGEVFVESPPGEGTRFEISLPIG